MIYCPCCRQSYAPSHSMAFRAPLSCPRCGNKRLLRWDLVYRARRVTCGPPAEQLQAGGRMT